MASRTRSAGESFLSMRAIRRGEKPDLASIDTRDFSGMTVAPCLIRAFLYSRSACRKDSDRLCLLGTRRTLTAAATLRTEGIFSTQLRLLPLNLSLCALH